MARRLGIVMDRQKVCKGYVVKREYLEEDPSTKKMVKHRVEIGRMYASRDAAVTLMEMVKKEHPDWTLYIHEKMGYDGLSHAVPA